MITKFSIWLLTVIIFIVLNHRNNEVAEFMHKQIEMFYNTSIFLLDKHDKRFSDLFFDENDKEIPFVSTIENQYMMVLKFWILDLKKFRKNKELFDKIEKIYNEEVAK